MNKIWKDPVWSKVISAGIIGLIGFIYVIIKSSISELSFKDSFINIINSEIPLYLVVIIIVGLLLFQVLYAFLTGKINILSREEKYLNNKMNAICRQNAKFPFFDLNIIARYSVGFNKIKGIPVVYDVSLFCSNHNPPLKIFEDKCYASRECEYEDNVLYADEAQSIIESHILQEWEDLDLISAKAV